MISMTLAPHSSLHCMQAKGAQTEGMWVHRWAATR